jgi:GntR family transcriptional regulator, arabinose operon transcriptional repressor
VKNNSNSKYYKLKEFLKEEILSGRIKPGEQIPSENTLTARFSLSRHTVRKAIAILINDGLLYTEHGRGTFSSGIARKNRDSRNIGVITTYISEYIFPQVIHGIDEVLSGNGYSIILKNTGNDCQKEASCLKDMLDKDIAGLIVEPTRSALFSNNIKYYEALERYNIPYVFIHGCHEQLQQKPCILLDDAGGMFELVSYLIKSGHKSIAGIFKADDTQGLNRHKGYVKALTEHGILYNPENVIWFHTEDRSVKPYAVIKSMLENRRRFDAIACYNDEIAYKIVEVLNQSGIKVPEDISVTGFDDSFLAVSCPVKLTTARHPKEKLGKAAAELILELIAGTEQKPVRIIQPEIIIRNSCRKRT